MRTGGPARPRARARARRLRGPTAPRCRDRPDAARGYGSPSAGVRARGSRRPGRPQPAARSCSQAGSQRWTDRRTLQPKTVRRQARPASVPPASVPPASVPPGRVRHAGPRRPWVRLQAQPQRSGQPAVRHSVRTGPTSALPRPGLARARGSPHRPARVGHAPEHSRRPAARTACATPRRPGASWRPPVPAAAPVAPAASRTRPVSAPPAAGSPHGAPGARRRDRNPTPRAHSVDRRRGPSTRAAPVRPWSPGKPPRPPPRSPAGRRTRRNRVRQACRRSPRAHPHAPYCRRAARRWCRPAGRCARRARPGASAGSRWPGTPWTGRSDGRPHRRAWCWRGSVARGARATRSGYPRGNNGRGDPPPRAPR